MNIFKSPKPQIPPPYDPTAQATGIGASIAQAHDIAQRRVDASLHAAQMQAMHNSAMMNHPTMMPSRVHTMAKPSAWEDVRRLEMIAMRLHLQEGMEYPFQHISTAAIADKVFVFVVQNDQSVTLEDDRAMFPSDVLITQLRLLMK